MQKFSVVIPTLQRSDRLWPLVLKLDRHPRVGEILIVNNAPIPLVWESAKVRILQQSENIFVNAAWNLGASCAREEYLCISNDDIDFDDRIIDYAAEILDAGRFSLAGPAPSSLNGHNDSANHRHSLSPRRPFGTLMFMVTNTYVPIPEGPLIWGGDDWLFWNRDKPVAEIRGFAIRTEMSATAGEYVELPIREKDRQWWLAQEPLIPVRSWHRKVKAVRRLKSMRLWRLARRSHVPAKSLMRLAKSITK